jgi:Ca2+-binding RTX toxin-like protein
VPQEVPVKKFSNATSAVAAQHPRALARLVLAFVASLLVVLLGLMGMSSGPNGAAVFAQATASPTGSPVETGPAIKLLNPSQAYDPNLALPPRPPGSADPPSISDKFDGVDRLYHVVAVTRAAPANSVVEAYFEPSGLNEITVGTLTKVAGSEDTWEFFWDVPDNLPVNSGTFKVRLFQATSNGFEEVANDETAARIAVNEETAEISWPSNNGQLGFHKPKGGFWRGVMEGTASGDTLRIFAYYSTTPPGQAVKYTKCAQVRLGPLNSANNTKPWAASCTLAGKDLPSMVTAVAALAIEDDKPEIVTTAEFTQESADAHRVNGYVQDVALMTVDLKGIDGAGTAAYPSGKRRQAMQPRGATSANAPNACLKFDAIVKDHLGRPVQGANLDVHVQGPDDQLAIGSDQNAGTSSADSTYKAPDQASHSKESAKTCPDFTDTPEDDRGTPSEEQGEHNVPGGPDIKHVESVAGTGLDTASADVAFKFVPGTFRFFVYSPRAGFTDITAWVDDEPIATESATREADDDLLETTEPSATLQAQWLPAPASVTFSPRADSAPVGECNKYTVRVRAGNAVLPGINVDVHAQGPNNDLDFCDPGDGSPRRAPDLPSGDAAHQAEDEGESSHKSESPDRPQLQHTEGETDDDGNFVIGITSAAVGQTQLTAWIDGEQGQDNDVRDGSEATGTGSKSWVGSAADAEVRFVNPSAYAGSGDKISNKRDADNSFHIVARVDLPDVVPGVEFFLGSGSTFTKIGDGTRVADSDTWEFFWPVNVADGSYTLRAQIIGTEKREDRAVTVNNQPTANDPRDVPFEAAEISRPLNATSAPFDKGATTVAGVASAGARGVDLYYTKTAARETRDSASWIRCGTVSLPGGSAPQNFEGKCELMDPDGDGTKDFPLEVTGLAAIAFRCDPVSGCTAQGPGKIFDTGDAHRVFGFEANPIVTIEPAEAAAQTTQCQRFELSVKDASGLGIADVNVDVHLTGPTDTAEFCDLADGSPRRFPDRAGHAASPNQGDEGIHQEDGSDSHHTEGETDSGGEFVFGVTSGTSGDSQILAWADQNDNDELDSDERSDTAIMHWGGGGSNSKCTIKGDGKDNVLRGTRRADIICGGGGDDVIRGRGGNDRIYGGGGNDTLRGNGGGDLIKGGPGNDRLDGGRGRDRCRPGRGRDSRVNCES